MKYTTIALALLIATQAAAFAEVIRWTDNEGNRLLVEDDRYRWERLAVGDDFGGGPGWTVWKADEPETVGNGTNVTWQLDQIYPKFAVDDNDVRWSATEFIEGPWAMWSKFIPQPGGSLVVHGFRHWSANLGIGGVNQIDSYSVTLRVVPEPSSGIYLLCLTGVGLLWLLRRN